MKKLIISTLIVLCFLTVAAATGEKNEVMRKQSDGTYIVNTTTLCDKKGFRGTTPAEVYIKNGKVTKVVALSNNETPRYFEKVTTHLIPLFTDLKIDKALKLTQENIPDGCTGATLSSKAFQANISAALDYYKKHK